MLLSQHSSEVEIFQGFTSFAPCCEILITFSVEPIYFGFIYFDILIFKSLTGSGTEFFSFFNLSVQ